LTCASTSPIVDEMTEPISPELVLVDPELAREARLRLPDPPAPPRYVPPEPRPQPAAQRRRAVSFRVTLPLPTFEGAVGAFAALVIVVLALDLMPAGPRPTLAAAPAPAAPRTAAAPTPVSGGWPQRVWTWAPQSDAAGYRFTLTRDGRPFYGAEVAGTRVVLPDHLRFEPGAYLLVVTVRARSSPAHAAERAIVRSYFEVGPA
jgi:hypothetical protein